MNLTLGLTVINPALLYAGAALASIPVIIHLLNRLRFRRVIWAAMEFLLAAHRKNARRIRIEQLILLAIRVLIILLLAGAVGRPILEGLLAGLGRSSVHRILVIDDSYSMDAQSGVSGGKTMMKSAVATTEWLMKSFERRDGVSLILAGSKPHARIGGISFDHDRVRKVIERLSVSDSATDMVTALEEVKKVLADSKQERKVVYILTDNTRTAWRDASGTDLRGLAASIAEQADLVVVDFSRGGQPNLAVEEFYPERAVVTENILSDFRVTVRNFADQAAEGVVVNVSVDGKAARPVVFGRIEAGKTVTRRWSHVFEIAGEYALEASLKDPPNDAVAADSRRYLAVNVKRALNVLLVDGEPRTGPADNETDYLRLALDPRTRDQQRETIFLTTWIRDSELDAAALAGMDVVILANVGFLNASQQNALRRFVQDGGSLMVFLGDQVQAALYNRELYEEGRGLLPAFLAATLGSTDPGKEDQYTSFDVRYFDHPALAAFKAAGGSGGLDAVRIARYFQLKLPPEEGAADVVLYLKDGNPGIVERTFGRGRVVLWATTADAEWTNFPRLPGYLALVHELMDYMTPDVLWRVNRMVDSETAIPVSAARSRDPVVVTGPRRTQMTLTPEVIEGERFAVRVRPLDESGVYTLDGAGLDRMRLAVNVDPTEGDLTHLTRDDLAERLGGAPMVYAVGQGGLEEALKTQQAAGGWARNLLYAMVVLCLVETFLAWFFNRGA